MSSKLRRLVADLAALGSREDGSPRKAVVFSQHRAAVKHADLVLAHAGISHVTITKGDAQANLETAVESWTTLSDCQVFLLHAGAAAAGLTLVAAQHVYLLEPFDKPGQELQALNRCHRIGQTGPVVCTVYFAARTVEERMLAFRLLEQHQAPEVMAEVQSGGEAEAGSLLAGANEKSDPPPPHKLRYLLGSVTSPDTLPDEEGDEEDGE